MNADALSVEEKMKRNVQIMKRALRSSKLEKKIHNEVSFCFCVWGLCFLFIYFFFFFFFAGYQGEKCKKDQEMVK